MCTFINTTLQPGPGLLRQFLTDVTYTRAGHRWRRERCQSPLLQPTVDRSPWKLTLELMAIARRPHLALQFLFRDPERAALFPEDFEVEHVAPGAVAVLLIGLARAIRHGRRAAPPPAREALVAALTARFAAIHGDRDTVDAFSRDWLGLEHPARWREAVENALLGDWVHQLGQGPLRDPELLALLQRHAAIEHRHLQPLWERKVRGKRTVLLSQPVGTDLTIADLLVEHRTPESEALWAEIGDSRLARVLQHLAPQEKAVAWCRAQGAPTWPEAARAAGLPTAYGERVRRKLKYLGAKHAAGCANAP